VFDEVPNTELFGPHPGSRFSQVRVRLIVIYDFTYVWEWNFDDPAIGSLHLEGWRRQSLCCFHATDDSAHACSIQRDDLDVVFAEERLQGCEGFCNFHFVVLSFSINWN
jgi:hypothetical protein